MRVLFLFLLFTTSLNAQPWGKDADLLQVKRNKSKIEECKTPIFGLIGEKVIRFHQKVISPADGPRSNFKPCSSQYALNAIRKYGFFRGFIMGCDRLMRENDDPWVYETVKVDGNTLIKYNPVP